MSIPQADEMLVLFAILAIGRWAGDLTVKGVSLGTAGVFFVALVFGHLGFSVPRPVMDLGLLLFVYAVGLQAGPRFFRTFARQGRQFVVIGLAAVIAAALATVAVARLWRLPFDLAAGLYAGAITCTPALAAAIDAAARLGSGQGATLSVGYGIAYPFSMIGVVLLIQVLPGLLHRDVRAEETAWLAEQRTESPDLVVRQFQVTNPNVEGRRIRDINPHRMSLANVSRVRHNDRVAAATPDLVLHVGDVVMCVGPEEELEKMRFILGEETHVPMDANTNVVAADSEVAADSLVGHTLSELRIWESYSVVITRLRRQGLEMTPTGHTALEMGDSVRVVGEQAAVDHFVRLIGGDHRRIDEVNMLPFLVGLLVGIAVGTLPVPLPNGITLRLGGAGGAFIVSLLFGHFGHIGPLRLYVPAAAKNLSRELGLMLFLAGAGTNAGSKLVSVLQQQGPGLFLAGALITVTTVAVSMFLIFRVYRFHTLSALGALCAAMTNPPGLGAASAQTSTDMPALAYASVYPVALIFKIVVAQLLVILLGSRL